MLIHKHKCGLSFTVPGKKQIMCVSGVLFHVNFRILPPPTNCCSSFCRVDNSLLCGVVKKFGKFVANKQFGRGAAKIFEILRTIFQRSINRVPVQTQQPLSFFYKDTNIPEFIRCVIHKYCVNSTTLYLAPRLLKAGLVSKQPNSLKVILIEEVFFYIDNNKETSELVCINFKALCQLHSKFVPFGISK